MPSISIAMGTFNGAKYIAGQLDSIAKQTRLPAELVVTDDGSTDGTLAILEDFADSAPFPVRVFHNEQNLGYKANFLKCAALCTGDLIAFSDQDDIWQRSKLAVQAKQFSDPHVLLSSHNVRLMSSDSVVSDKTWDMFPKSGAYTVDMMLPFALNFGFTQMFRRELLALSPYWSAKMAHDEYLFFAASVIGLVHYDAAPLANYRQHPLNVSGQKTVKSLTDRLRYKFGLGAGDYQRYIENSTERVRILKLLAADTNLSWMQRQSAHAAVGRYQGLRMIQSRRLDIYQAASLSCRLSALMDLVRSGQYGLRPDPWRFTAAGFVKDALAAVITDSAKRSYGSLT